MKLNRKNAKQTHFVSALTLLELLEMLIKLQLGIKRSKDLDVRLGYEVKEDFFN
jgi:hypothetical protein